MMSSDFTKEAVKWAGLHALCFALPALPFSGPRPLLLLLAACVFALSFVAQLVFYYQHAGALPTLPKDGKLLDADWKHWWSRHLAAPRFDENENRECFLLLKDLQSNDPLKHATAFEQAKARKEFARIIVEAYGYPSYEPWASIVTKIGGLDRPDRMAEAMRSGMHYPRFDQQFRPITTMAISPVDGTLSLDALDLFLVNGADINDTDLFGVGVLEAMADAHALNKESPLSSAYRDDALPEAAIACLERGIQVRDECLAKLRALGEDGAKAAALIEQKRFEANTDEVASAAPARRQGRL